MLQLAPAVTCVELVIININHRSRSAFYGTIRVYELIETGEKRIINRWEFNIVVDSGELLCCIYVFILRLNVVSVTSSYNVIFKIIHGNV